MFLRPDGKMDENRPQVVNPTFLLLGIHPERRLILVLMFLGEDVDRVGREGGRLRLRDTTTHTPDAQRVRMDYRFQSRLSRKVPQNLQACETLVERPQGATKLMNREGRLVLRLLRLATRRLDGLRQGPGTLVYVLEEHLFFHDDFRGVERSG